MVKGEFAIHRLVLSDRASWVHTHALGARGPDKGAIARNCQRFDVDRLCFVVWIVFHFCSF